jgi:hypothetical protein
MTDSRKPEIEIAEQIEAAVEIFMKDQFMVYTPDEKAIVKAAMYKGAEIALINSICKITS